MSSQNKLYSLLQQLRTDFPVISFEESDLSRWSPKTKTVNYSLDPDTDPAWSLLHEVGHMQAGHKRYSTDIELVKMESEAWALAKKLAPTYGYTIDADYIEDCMDSYRRWLHKRSKCVKCTQTGIEQTSGQYRCINCGTTWDVADSRFCRVYRRTKNTA